MTSPARRHPFRALADRLPAYRRRAHGLVQLAVRPASRRQVPAAHRGHRQGALDRARRSTRSSTGCAGSASIGTATNITSRNSGRATPRSPTGCSSAAHAYRCYMTQEELAAQREAAPGERRPFRIDSPWRDARRRARRQAVRHPPEGAARGRDGDRRPGPGPGRRSRMPRSTISSCSARTAPRPTCWRWWSTITTWASPTSSAATTISTTPSASWRSSARWAGPSRPMPTSR